MNTRMICFLLAMCAVWSAGATNARADQYQDGLAAWIKGDFANGVRLLTPLADRGDPAAQTIVGGAYAGGWGVEKDCGKGLELLSEAAQANYPQAQYAMGRLSATGTCLAKSYENAFMWYKKGAALHDPDAEFAVGYFYNVGRVVPMDIVEAYRWYTMCVSDGKNAPSYSRGNVEAAKNNLNQMHSMMSEDEIARANALISASR